MEDQLFQTLCTRETLYLAWLRVKEKNTAGGIDLQTVHQYAVTVDKNLDGLADQLQTGDYKQQPYREVFIPKNKSEKRRLGLLTVNDKIVQTAVTMLVSPVIERSFLNVSYAYRSNKGPVKAINQVQHLITNERYTWLASCDIDNFFDTIPHDPLFARLSAYLKSPGITELIRMFVQMGRVNRRHQWKDNRKGIPQGGVISPLLANFYLYPLDKLMVSNKYGYVRYADDFIILGHTREEAEQALSEAMEIITRHLGLALNEGAEIVPVKNGFEFLGIFFDNGAITLSDKKYKRLVGKMAEAAGKGTGLVSEKLKEVIQGIAAFYGKLIPQNTLEQLDDELLAILLLRSELLWPGKDRKGVAIAGLQPVQFLAQAHNIYKTEYINKQFSQTTTPYEPGRKGKKRKSKSLRSREAVLMRKHEYQKMESSGFDLVITQPGLAVGKRDKTVTVKKHGIVIQEAPIVNLKNITILCNGVSFSSNLVRTCSENKIPVTFLQNNGMPYAMVVTPDFFDARKGIAQLEAYENGKAFSLIRNLVAGKIRNQSNQIKYYGKYYQKRNESFKAAFPQFVTAMAKFVKAAFELKQYPLDDFRLKMFAVEGQASSRYWEMIGILLEQKTDFHGRERKGATDLVNCMFNYGYGILYARVTEAILHARLNPCLSYLHKPEGNRPSLVFDLVEEFRQQAVDRVIFALIMKNKNLKAENGLLDNYTRNLVAQKVIDRINNIEVFRGTEIRFSEIILSQANTLAKFLEGKTKSYKPYSHKW